MYTPNRSLCFASPESACVWADSNASGPFVAYVRGYHCHVRVTRAVYIDPNFPVSHRWDYGSYSEES